MSEIRVELAPEFKGETVVLLAMDGSGLDAFISAATEAFQKGPGASSQLKDTGANHVFVIEDGRADVELQKGSTTWRFSPSKLGEVLEKLEAMKASPGPCHHYVDISSPAETLVLSRDEYV
jgi:hypothetical protein